MLPNAAEGEGSSSVLPTSTTSLTPLFQFRSHILHVHVLNSGVGFSGAKWSAYLLRSSLRIRRLDLIAFKTAEHFIRASLSRRVCTIGRWRYCKERSGNYRHCVYVLCACRAQLNTTGSFYSPIAISYTLCTLYPNERGRFNRIPAE